MAEGKTTQHSESLGERVAQKSHEQTTVHGHQMDRATIFKFAGLIAFVALIAVIVVVAWPYIADVFTEGGVDRLVERVRNAGLNIVAVCAILDRQEGGREAIKEAGYDLLALFTREELVRLGRA